MPLHRPLTPLFDASRRSHNPPVVASGRPAATEPLEARCLMHAGHDHDGDGGGGSAAVNPAGSVFVDAGNMAAPFTDAAGATTWAADANFIGGKRVRGRFAVAGTDDDALFATRRQGKAFAYSVPVTDGSYTLSLLFVDTVKRPGKRLFHVDAESARLESNLDIVARAGGRRTALVLTHDVTVTGGALELALTRAKGRAVLSGFSLVPIAGEAVPPPLPTVPPPAPTGLAAAAPSATAITVTWDARSDDLTGFELQRSADGGAAFVPLLTPPADATTHTDTAGVAPGATYQYRLRAVNAAGASAWSAVAAATTPPDAAAPAVPAAPSSLTAQALSPTSVALSWSDNAADETSYVVERAINGDDFDVLVTLPADSMSHRDDTATADVPYAYRVRAANAVGPSAASNEASLTTPPAPGVAPAAPSDLAATVVSGGGEVRLSWSDNAADETGFVVERAANGGAFAAVATPAAGATRHTDATVLPGDTYAYRVRAANDFGQSSPSNEVSATTPAAPGPVDPFTRIDWTTRAAGPIGRSEALRAVVGGKLYVFAGFSDGNGPGDRADVYDPATDGWTRIEDVPRPLTHAGTVADGRDVYFIGGYIGTGDGYQQQFGTAEVWKYNVDSDRYTRLPDDLPDDRAGGGAAVLGRNLHYFSGNNSARRDVADHYVLGLDDPAAGWSIRAPLPTARSHMGYATFGGRIYALGGQTGNDEDLTTVTAVHSYDPATDAWTARKSMPKAISHVSSSTFVLGGRILVAGGETDHNEPTADVFAYDPAADDWSTLTPLLAARFSGAAGAIGDLIYFTSGSSKTTTYLGTPG